MGFRVLFDATLAVQTMRHVEGFLDQHHIDCDDPHLVLKRNFNEAWFSNMLAWLLDPKGSHGLGTEFLQEFLKLLAKKRSSQEDGYAREASFLKWGREGLGRTTSGLALGNASAAREFFLASEIGKEASQGSRFCDVVLLDLDPDDGLFVAIENKLFTTNHHHQLQDYYHTIESRYRRANIREYVYLTFHGFHPLSSDRDSSLLNKAWLRCSWTEDIAGILAGYPKEGLHRELVELLLILRWLKGIYSDRGESNAEEFRLQILHAAAYCLEEELNRLGEGRPGTWSIARQGKTVKLVHSSNPKSPLLVELLPTLSVAVQGHRQGRPSFEKIVIPYGVNTDQIFNLLDIAARDIYRAHFGDRASTYLNTNKRRLQKRGNDRKQEVKPLFDFISAHFEALRVLFTVSLSVWDQGPMDA